jgi:hypothetical protein
VRAGDLNGFHISLLLPAILCGDVRQISNGPLVQKASRGSVNLRLMLAEKAEGNSLIDLSAVVRPLVDLMLRDEAPTRRSAIGHPELNPFEDRLGAASNRCPCHLSPCPLPLEEWLRWLADEVEDVPEFAAVLANGEARRSGNAVDASCGFLAEGRLTFEVDMIFRNFRY